MSRSYARHLFGCEDHSCGGCGRQPRKKNRPNMSPTRRQRVLERDGHRCQECGATELLEIDHVVPVAHGGTEDESNLQVLCEKCNNRKGARV